MLTNQELKQKYSDYPRGYYPKFLIVNAENGEIVERSVLRGYALDSAKSYKFDVAVIEIPPKKKTVDIE